jgi:hypothetical protein
MADPSHCNPTDVECWIRHFEKQAKGESTNIRYGPRGGKIYIVDTSEKKEVAPKPKKVKLTLRTSVQSGIERANAAIERANQHEGKRSGIHKRRKMKVAHSRTTTERKRILP